MIKPGMDWRLPVRNGAKIAVRCFIIKWVLWGQKAYFWRSSFPYLDVSATWNEGEVVIAVVNRHKEKPIRTDIISQTGSFTDNFTVYEITGPGIKAVNDFGNEVVRNVEKPQLRARGDQITYTFPPLSVTMLKGRIGA